MVVALVLLLAVGVEVGGRVAGWWQPGSLSLGRSVGRAGARLFVAAGHVHVCMYSSTHTNLGWLIVRLLSTGMRANLIDSHERSLLLLLC